MMKGVLGQSISRRNALGVALGLTAAPALARTAQEPAFDQLTAKAQALVSGRTTPGLAVAILRQGRFVYSRGFGHANLETATPVTPASIFRIGSITKEFTAAALLRLQEADLLSIDDQLAKTLPEVPRADKISLRQMLNHTSGMGNFTNTDPLDIFMQRARTDYDQAALLKAMLAADPMFIGEPGAQYTYSNTAYVLLGIVIERVTGKPLPEAFNALCSSAGLQSTAADDAADVVPGRASGYTPRASASSGFANAGFVALSYPAAAGNMRSTPEDLCRWQAALLAGKVLKPATLEEMLKPGLLSNGQLPTSSKDDAAKPVKFGLGISAKDTPHGVQYSHGGAILGFTSWVGSHPAANVHMAYIINADSGFTKTSTMYARLGEFQELLERVAVA